MIYDRESVDLIRVDRYLRITIASQVLRGISGIFIYFKNVPLYFNSYGEDFFIGSIDGRVLGITLTTISTIFSNGYNFLFALTLYILFKKFAGLIEFESEVV